MSINVTPSVEPYKYTGSFKFWCQKVLPLVYDDSLSYYELLCKVVNYLNDVIKNVDGLKTDIDNIVNSFNELQDYVNNYFDNLDVQEEINNKLDDMAESGALGTLLIEALNLRMLQERKEKFQDNVRRNVISYLARNYGGTYFATGGASPVDNIKMVTKYSNSNSWQSYRWGSTPVYNETENISGEDYKIMYCDCSSFSSLIYANISYDNSPYLYGFSGGEVNSEEMILKGFPKISYDNDWCLDFNSLQNTDQMSYLLTESGLNPLMLSKHVQGEEIEYNTENLQTLETGDIIFSGSGVIGGNLYENTGHCLVYIETLEELNELANTLYGCTFKPTDNDDATWGYVAEVNYSTSEDNDYTNCLNFGTLKHHMDREVKNSQNITYAYKITPRVTVSNPATHKYSGIWRDYNKLYFTPIHYDNPLESKIKMELSPGRIHADNFRCIGEQISRDMADANLLKQGIWRCTSAVYEDMKNVPTTSNYFILEGYGEDINGAFYGIQTFTILSSAYPNKWVRSCSNGTWSKWVKIPQIQNGTVNTGNIEANGFKNVTVTYPVEFDINAFVTLTPALVGASLKNVVCVLSNYSKTGFKATVYNTGSTAVTDCQIVWNAISNDGITE